MKRKYLLFALPLVVIASAFCIPFQGKPMVKSEKSGLFEQAYISLTVALDDYAKSVELNLPDTGSKKEILIAAEQEIEEYENEVEEAYSENWARFPLDDLAESLGFFDNPQQRECRARLYATQVREFINCRRDTPGSIGLVICTGTFIYGIRESNRICKETWPD